MKYRIKIFRYTPMSNYLKCHKKGKYMVREMKTVTYIIKDCKSRYDWVKKVIYWELFKGLQFNNINKWYMPNPESLQVNLADKILRNFEIYMDHPIHF